MKLSKLLSGYLAQTAHVQEGRLEWVWDPWFPFHMKGLAREDMLLRKTCMSFSPQARCSASSQGQEINCGKVQYSLPYFASSQLDFPGVFQKWFLCAELGLITEYCQVWPKDNTLSLNNNKTNKQTRNCEEVQRTGVGDKRTENSHLHMAGTEGKHFSFLLQPPAPRGPLGSPSFCSRSLHPVIYSCHPQVPWEHFRPQDASSYLTCFLSFFPWAWATAKSSAN